MDTLLAMAISYLIGSIPVGVLAAKSKGINIMSQGSGNTGATNVWRSLGPYYGVLVLLIDMFKGVAAVLLGRYLGGVETELLAAFCALCGHSWSVFLRFKGGKIVSTGAGAFLAISPTATFIAMVSLLVTLGISRYVSLSSIVGALTIPVAMLVLHMDSLYIAYATAVAIFVIYKHRSNIQRILSGTEYKIGKKKA